MSIEGIDNTMTAQQRFDDRKRKIATETKDIKKLQGYTQWVGAACICVGIILGAYATYLKLADRIGFGEFGSLLSGAVSPMFTLAGTAYVVFTFLGQKQQSLSQEEQIAQNEYQIEVNRLEVELQRFEATFFQLLQRYDDMVDSLDVHMHDRTKGLIPLAKGRESFEIFYRRFKESADVATDIGRTQKSYTLFFQTYQGSLAHYFGHCEQILLYLDRAPDPSVGRRLADIFRAQLSTFEVLLLFYHAIMLRSSGSTLDSLVERHRMLQGISDGMLVRRQHKDYYGAKAYLASSDK
jgi:hypothetical protein